MRGYGRLPAETVQHGRHRESPLCRGHFKGRLCAQGPNRFVLRLPAGIQGRASCLLAHGCASRPPCLELLAPPFGIAGAALTRMRSPVQYVSMCSHTSLLPVCGPALERAVRSANRLVDTIAPHARPIQRIVISIIMPDIHQMAGSTRPAHSARARSRVARLPPTHNRLVARPWLSPPCCWVRRVVKGRGLILADVGIARLRGNLQPLALQDQIDGRDFILGLDRVVGDMINGDYELGHGGPSCHERDEWRSPMACAGMMPCKAHYGSECPMPV